MTSLVGVLGRGLAFSATLAILLALALPARADAGPKRPWLVAFGPSVYFASGQMQGGGPDEAVPPPVYLGLTLERSIWGPLDVNVSAGAAASLGYLLGATVRYAGPPPSRRTHVSVGVGPEIVTGESLGTGAFAQGDVAIEARFDNGFALVFGPRVAIAVTHAGTPGCGVDTCSAYMKPGDFVITLRSGIGFTF
jgi:hypothetical protein